MIAYSVARAARAVPAQLHAQVLFMPEETTGTPDRRGQIGPASGPSGAMTEANESRKAIEPEDHQRGVTQASTGHKNSAKGTEGTKAKSCIAILRISPLALSGRCKMGVVPPSLSDRYPRRAVNRA